MEDDEHQCVEALEQPRQTRAETLFGWYQEDLLALPDSDLKRFSLAILDSGIFWRGGLKGKRAQIRKQGYVTYPIKDLGGLIAKLVNAHLARLNLNIYEIRERQLRWAMAGKLPYDLLFQDAKTLGVANQAEIDRICQNGLIQDLEDLADKVMDAYNEILQKPLPLSLAMILHTYAPSAPPARLADWVNKVLKALGQDPIPDRTLWGHIKDELIQKGEIPHPTSKDNPVS